MVEWEKSSTFAYMKTNRLKRIIRYSLPIAVVLLMVSPMFMACEKVELPDREEMGSGGGDSLRPGVIVFGNVEIDTVWGDPIYFGF